LTQTTLQYDQPRLTGDQRLQQAEGVFRYLADDFGPRLRVAILDRPEWRDNWTALYSTVLSPFPDVEEFRAMAALVPGPRWREFLDLHHGQPGFFWALLSVSRRAKLKRSRYSIDFIGHLIRWESDDGGTPEDGEPWKVNNNHLALYARLLALFDPELQRLFEFRRSPKG